MIRHLFFLLVVGPLVFLFLIGWDLAHPREFLQELVELPLWMKVALVVMGVGTFLETARSK